MPNNSHYHFLHLPHWHLPGLSGLYLNASLRNLAVAMINIFIPIYILETTGDLLFVFAFYLVYRGFLLFLDYPLIVFMSKIGPDFSSLLSGGLLALYLFVLTFIGRDLSFLFLATFLGAIVIPLYWVPYHLAFIKLAEKGRYGRSFSLLSVLGRFTSSLGPIIGGFIISFWGFNFLFSLAIILIFLSTFPLFLDNFKKTGRKPSLNEVLKGFLEKKERGSFLAFFGTGLESLVYTVFWPLFIYFSVRSYKTLGIISSASLVFTMVVLFWAGRYVDKRGIGIIKVGVLGNSLNWVVRLFCSTGLHFFLSDLFYQLGGILLWTPFNTVMYKKARKGKTLTFLTQRELAIHFGQFFGAFLAFVVYLIEPSWLLVFLVAIFGLFLSTFMIKVEDG